MKDVEVIIPWFSALEDEDRSRALAWCCHRWTALGYGPPALARSSAKRFCKADAVSAAVRSSDASWLVVADADVQPPADMDRALAAVRWDGHPWAKPYTNVYRLNKQATNDWFQCKHVELFDIQNLAQEPYIGIPGGGVVVISRENYLQVPLDKRFVGWGGEDASWGYALHTILGPPWVGMSNLIHFWHLPQERLDRRTGNTDNEELRKRYLFSVSKADKMQALVNEGK